MGLDLISPSYRAINIKLHEEASYGTSGRLHCKDVDEFAAWLGVKTILDYGCGKRFLGFYLMAHGWKVENYDPGIPYLSKSPEPADLVTCTDVLEHIEPEHLDAVLDDIKRLARMAVYFAISTRESRRILPDGRNAHLIVQTERWWLEQLKTRWMLRKRMVDDLLIVAGVRK